jgi:hypothetical protein
MTEFAGIFEVLAADDSDRRVASRKALVLARARIDQRLGSFLSAARSQAEFDARYDLVAGDFAGIVRVAADEVGHGDANSLLDTLRTHYAENWIQDAVKKPGDLHKKLHVPEGENISEEKIENAEKSGDKNLKEKAQFAENVKGLGKKKKSKKKNKKNKGKPPWLQDDDGDNDGNDNDDSLDFAASTADAVPLVAKTADKGNTDLNGPSPKMKKQRWTPKSVTPDQLKEIGDANQIDILEVIPKKNEGPPGDIGNIDQIGDIKVEKLPSGKGLDDGGFADNNMEMAPHTKTFGDGGQVDPVTSVPSADMG